MDDLVLYHNPGSRSERVLKLLQLTELPHRVQIVRPNAMKSPDYLALNPLGTVPALQYGTRVIVESAAQMMHLADLVPPKGLAPPVGTLERAIWYELFVFATATVEPMALPGIQDPHDPAKRERLHHAMGLLTDRLVGPFAIGEAFTAVDVLVHWQMSFCARAGLLDELPASLAYVGHLADRLEWSDPPSGPTEQSSPAA